MPETKSAQKTGRVIQVIGPVLDVEFEEGHLPSILNAVHVTWEMELDGKKTQQELTAEVEQHLGEGRCRCVAMEPTEGLRRGAKVTDTGGPIMVPVGKEILGRVLNVLGKPVDSLGPVK